MLSIIGLLSSLSKTEGLLCVSGFDLLFRFSRSRDRDLLDSDVRLDDDRLLESSPPDL